jgi:hypothetical protein
MRIIPYERFNLELRISAEQAALRLAEATDQRRTHTFMPFSQSPGQFQATISNGNFHLRRADPDPHAISVQGRFVPTGNGSRLEATFSMFGSSAVSFISFFVAIAMIAVVIKDSLQASGHITVGATASIGVVLIMYLFFFLAWKAETRSVRRFLYLVYLGRPRV